MEKYIYTQDAIFENPTPIFDEPWISYFMNIAKVVSTKSKDPSTKVGAVAVEPTTKRILATGYNGFPSGVEETKERWERPRKYAFVTHAEGNIIASAARFGINLTGATLFVTLHPCVDCAKLIASAGIKSVIFIESELKQQSGRDWISLIEDAKSIFNESGISLYSCKAVTEKKPVIGQPERHKTWKGYVDNWEELSTKRNVQLGDLIFVKHNNTLYEWNGVIWVVIGEYQHIV